MGSSQATMLAKFSVFCLLVAGCLARPQRPEVEDGVKQVGDTLNKLPEILSKTAEWFKDLGSIGDEIHPSVGDTIREGAGYVKEASNNVPDDLDKQVQTHLNKLIDLVKGIKGSVVDGLKSAPGAVEDLDGPVKDYAEAVIRELPSAQEVDDTISEAIRYLEPLSEALGSEQKEE